MDHFHDSIGIVGLPDIHSLLETSFKKLPYDFNFFDDIKLLPSWIQKNHPRMILFNKESLHSRSLLDSTCKNLINSLNQFHVLSMFFSQSIDEIQEWRGQQWPNLHFYHGTLHEKSLKKKIINLLMERYFLERPLVAIISESRYLEGHLEMTLKNYGMRLLFAIPHHFKQSLLEIGVEGPDAILWDPTSWMKFRKYKDKDFEVSPYKDDPLNYIISESVPANTSKITEDGSVRQSFYTLDRQPQLIRDLLNHILKRRRVQRGICRDTHTGLYLCDLLIDLSVREMDLANRFKETFSIMKLYVGNIDEVEEKYGETFARELELNLGIFVQNRVRMSDLVFRGNWGDVLLLLPRVTRDLGTLVGERLRHSFSKIAMFDPSKCHSILPKLEYQSFNYPLDIKSIDDVSSIIQRPCNTAPNQAIK